MRIRVEIGVAVPRGQCNGISTPHFTRWFVQVYAPLAAQEDKSSTLSLAEFFDIFRTHTFALPFKRQEVVKQTNGFREVDLKHLGKLAWNA